MIKILLRKLLNEHTINEAVAMSHFNDRVRERLDKISSIELSDPCFLPNLPKDVQTKWIIDSIKKSINSKIAQVLAKDYLIDNGVCVLVPLGEIRVKPVKFSSTEFVINASGFKGLNYYIGIYDNRMPTFVLADPNLSNNENQAKQLNAHIYDNKKNDWPINYGASYIDSSFDQPLIIKMADFRDSYAINSI